MAVRIGEAAPAFEAEAWVRSAGRPATVSLSQFRGSYLVLFFYSRDFGPVCPTELVAFAERQEAFAETGAALLGASTDSFYAHKAWFESEARLDAVRFPVAADASHAVAEAFGVLMADGAAARATFIIDPNGIVQHIAVNPSGVGRSVDETLRVLQALRTGEDCPADWQPGDPTLTSYNEWLAKALPRLPKTALVEASERLEPVTFRAGETVFAQGDAPDRFYIVARGEAEVRRRGADGQERVVATLGPGEFFGEMGLVTETQRSATVRAKTDLEVLALEWDYFVSVIESSEAAGQAFAEIVRGRVAN